MSLLTRARQAKTGTVYMSQRCDACGRTPQLTQPVHVSVTHAGMLRPLDVNRVEVCADWRDCIRHFPKEARS